MPQPLSIEDVARLSAIITKRLKQVHKDLVDTLLEAVPMTMAPEEAGDFVVGLISTATFGLGAQMCIDGGLSAEEMRGALHSVLAENKLVAHIAEHIDATN